jgi:hypothetical protein
LHGTAKYFGRDLLNQKIVVFYIGNIFAYEQVALKTLHQGEKGLAVGKIAEKLCFFWNLKSENYSVLILSAQFWNFLDPTLLPIPLPVFFIYLQLASMIPLVLAATVKVIFLNFVIITFYSVQVIK